jgi:isopropylmalate/homocitrate/citramalate synthase
MPGRAPARRYEAGARWVVLCDTNGGTLPHEIEDIVGALLDTVPGHQLGIHAHNDTEQAVANSLAAVRAGVRQIQGTLNGIGERCGNANLVSIIPTLLLKDGYRDRFELGIGKDKLATLTHVSRAFDELLNRAPNRQAPYVGESAFTTKAGIHASALAKAPETYEHVPPETVGNRRRVLVSDQAGKSNLLAELERIGLKLARTTGGSMRCWPRSRAARRKAMPMRGRTPPSSCWRGGASARCRAISTSRASGSWSSTGTTRWASWSPSLRPSSSSRWTASA